MRDVLTRAENEASVAEMERDSLGRVVRETVNRRSIQSALTRRAIGRT
jgi:YD repeat-containing protein